MSDHKDSNEAPEGLDAPGPVSKSLSTTAPKRDGGLSPKPRPRIKPRVKPSCKDDSKNLEKPSTVSSSKGGSKPPAKPSSKGKSKPSKESPSKDGKASPSQKPASKPKPSSSPNIKRNRQLPTVPPPKSEDAEASMDSVTDDGNETLFNLMHISKRDKESEARRAGKNLMLLLPIFILALLISDIIFERYLDTLIPIAFITLIFLFLLGLRVDYELKSSSIEIYENGICLSTVRFSRLITYTTMATAIFLAAAIFPVLSFIHMDFRYVPFEVMAIFIFVLTYREQGQKSEKKARNVLYKLDPESEMKLVFYRKKVLFGKTREGLIDRIYLSNADSRTSIFNELGILTIDGRSFESGPKGSKEIAQMSELVKRQWS